jgi:ATP-dependent HslUV protease ATP-binding subunit HslU
MGINMKDVFPGLFSGRTRKRKMRVAEAVEYLVQEEEDKLIDMDQVTRTSIERVERSGIIFLLVALADSTCNGVILYLADGRESGVSH